MRIFKGCYNHSSYREVNASYLSLSFIQEVLRTLYLPHEDSESLLPRGSSHPVRPPVAEEDLEEEEVHKMLFTVAYQHMKLKICF